MCDEKVPFPTNRTEQNNNNKVLLFSFLSFYAFWLQIGLQQKAGSQQKAPNGCGGGYCVVRRLLLLLLPIHGWQETERLTRELFEEKVAQLGSTGSATLRWLPSYAQSALEPRRLPQRGSEEAGNGCLRFRFACFTFRS